MTLNVRIARSAPVRYFSSFSSSTLIHSPFCTPQKTNPSRWIEISSTKLVHIHSSGQAGKKGGDDNDGMEAFVEDKVLMIYKVR